MSLTDGTQTDVVDWRREQLENAGVPARLALTVALEPDADWRTLIRLVDEGCDPRTAWQILRP